MEFKGETLLITGGTGSFGHAVLDRFLKTDIGEIRIFSRDEKKQDDMRHEFQARMPEAADKIKFFIGDVRDLASLKNAMHGVDYVFHAAALKQVPSCEFFPLEAVKTNVIGTENVLTAAIDAGVRTAICLSTDKAAYPVNAMGTSKAMMEKVIVAKSRRVSPDKTKICCTRYGNVMCSRGSAIPLRRHPGAEGAGLHYQRFGPGREGAVFSQRRSENNRHPPRGKDVRDLADQRGMRPGHGQGLLLPGALRQAGSELRQVLYGRGHPAGDVERI